MRKAIVIDDEPDICELMTESLKEVGLKVTSFTNPLNALEKMKEEYFDIVVCDFVMPEMNGGELKKQVPQGQYQEYYLLTGETNLNDEEIEKFQFSQIFYKPEGILEIIEKIEEFLKLAA